MAHSRNYREYLLLLVELTLRVRRRLLIPPVRKGGTHGRGNEDVVCEPTRAQMLRALAATTLNVTELSRVVGRTKWTTSRHLRRLRANDLVTSRREGREVFYTLASGPTVDAALAALDVFERRSRDAR